MTRRWHIKTFIGFLILLICTIQGCSSKDLPTPSVSLSPTTPAPSDACGYSNFLIGSLAELEGDFDVAFNAFKQMRTCAPNIQLAENRIPLLLLKQGQRDDAISYLKEQINNNENVIAQKLILARLYLQEDKDQDAIDLYQEILKTDPEREDVLLRLGVIYTKQRQFERAKTLFSSLIDNNKDLYLGHLYLARLYLHTKENELAEKQYNFALKLNWSVTLLHEMVAFYKIGKNQEKVSELYRELIEYNPYDERAQFGLIGALIRSGKEDEALNQLKLLKEYATAPHAVDLIISKVYLGQNDNEQANKILTSLIKTPSGSEAKFLLALLHAQGDQNISLEYLEDINNDFLDFEEAIYLQTKLFRDLGRQDEAIKAVHERIINEVDRKPSFYGILAALYQEQDQVANAISTLSDGISQYPENIDLHFELGLILEKTGQHDIAITHMQRILDLNQNHAEALNFIGYVWADNNQNLDMALEFIERAKKLQPQSGYIRDSLGWVHFRIGNLELAKDHLLAALELENNDPHIYSHLGDVYVALGQKTLAIEAYHNAINLTQDQALTKDIQKKVKVLENS